MPMFPKVRLHSALVMAVLATESKLLKRVQALVVVYHLEAGLSARLLGPSYKCIPIFTSSFLPITNLVSLLYCRHGGIVWPTHYILSKNIKTMINVLRWN